MREAAAPAAIRTVRPRARDGDRIRKGAPVLEVAGPTIPLLTAERTALNFLQRLSGIATQAPTSLERLAALRSLPRGFERSKWGQDILQAVARGLARDPKTLPRIERPRGGGNGAATVELLKVLLRMTSERHAVAAKVIATIDELERIAADDHADVPALHGWRRELFGEKALALKHGRLALAIENGRVVAVERERANGE